MCYLCYFIVVENKNDYYGFSWLCQWPRTLIFPFKVKNSISQECAIIFNMATHVSPLRKGHRHLIWAAGEDLSCFWSPQQPSRQVFHFMVEKAEAIREVLPISTLGTNLLFLWSVMFLPIYQKTNLTVFYICSSQTDLVSMVLLWFCFFQL